MGPQGAQPGGAQPPGGTLGDGAEGSTRGDNGESLEAGGPAGEGGQGEDGESLEAGGQGGTGGQDGESLEAGGQGGTGAEVGGDMAGGPMGGGGVEGLDEQLEGSLEVFDQGMQGRRIVLASSLPPGADEAGGPDGGGQGAEGEGGPDDQTGGSGGLILGGEEGEGDGEGEPRVIAGLPGTASPGNQPGDNQREGDFKSGGIGGRVPPDVGDGSDDDVVARQIREAATDEPDPALREKLWEEYRTYKRNAG